MNQCREAIYYSVATMNTGHGIINGFPTAIDFLHEGEIPINFLNSIIAPMAGPRLHAQVPPFVCGTWAR
jgi:hypothetical protein